MNPSQQTSESFLQRGFAAFEKARNQGASEEQQSATQSGSYADLFPREPESDEDMKQTGALNPALGREPC